MFHLSFLIKPFSKLDKTHIVGKVQDSMFHIWPPFYDKRDIVTHMY